MSNVSNRIKNRNEYIERLRNELLGPGSEINIPDKEHELISANPEKRYSIGILFPQSKNIGGNFDENVSYDVEKDEEDAAEAADNEGIDDIDVQEIESEEKIITEKYDDVTDLDNKENLDEEAGLATQNKPASFGITFYVDENLSELNIKLKYARYRKATKEELKVPYKVDNPDEFEVAYFQKPYVCYDKEDGCIKMNMSSADSDKMTKKLIYELEKGHENLSDTDKQIFNIMRQLFTQGRSGYIREPRDCDLKISFGNDSRAVLDNINEENVSITALKRYIKDGIYSVTVMLVNKERAFNNLSLHCIFQPEITITTDDNNFTFKTYTDICNFNVLDDEEKNLELQYRNKKNYGSGLGTSLNWDINDEGKGKIFNDYFPIEEIPPVSFELPEDANVPVETLSMKYLSDLTSASKKEKLENLKIFIDSYREWIDKTEENARSLEKSEFRAVAEDNIAGCRDAYGRMLKGIDILSNDDDAWSAFELANRAMFMQRVHLQIQKQTSNEERYADDQEISNILDNLDYETADDIHKWRPFQLAFHLMSVESMTNDESSDRMLVDLIWFPTGGGKTEAYLGLTAFTIFYRRLKNSDSASGTSVIMRYTLRLLAAQQFTRASTLICACEFIRSDSAAKKPKYRKYPLGLDSITIGLWIGGDHVPNTNKKAEECWKSLKKGEKSDDPMQNNKFQVLKCPWCGTRLTPKPIKGKLVGEMGYYFEKGSFRMRCCQESCFFEDRLPIQVIDEELYKKPPTLLFSTVDKFAMLAWKAESMNFFANGNENRTPELIIQDELHLISGPLGTIVGLYETAVDALCSLKGVPAKIIASTATIRKAKEQCAALYDREVRQYPHPGIDAEDSFFAKESKCENEVFGRKYVGFMPSGKTKNLMEACTISALLQNINNMELPDEERDDFWTLTAYFNSLKEVGKCQTLIQDDVIERIRKISSRPGSKPPRPIVGADELTSRVSTYKLNETLDKLEKVSYSKENIEKKRYPSNIVLATNMISVGIDIARLNSMLLVGQPKLTSEYIQASSRVGREHPGIAFVMYDSTRSRDRSHFESFKSYHQSFYKYVEPTGATPFSIPARERALHAVVIILLRSMIPEIRDEKAAANFSKALYSKEINKITELINRRAERVSRSINASMSFDESEIIEEIDKITSQWEILSERVNPENFYYGYHFMFKLPEEGEERLMKVYNSDTKSDAFDTMTSVRNVDSNVTGRIIYWE